MIPPPIPRILIAIALFVGIGAVPCAAQTDAALAVGAGVAVYQPIDDDAHRAIGPAITYRFGDPQGLRPTFGLNWYALQFDGSTGTEEARLGRLRVRPFMGGYGYYQRRGRTALSATLVGGFALNSFDEDDRARLAFARRNVTLLRISAGNSAAARLELSAWFDINDKFGLLAATGYVLARPNITIVTSEGEERRRLRADAVKFQVGLVYAIF